MHPGPPGGLSAGIDEVAIVVPLDVGDLVFVQDGAHGVANVRIALRDAQVQGLLVAALHGEPAARGHDPLRVRPGQVGIDVDHLGFKPEPELHAETTHVVDESGAGRSATRPLRQPSRPARPCRCGARQTSRRRAQSAQRPPPRPVGQVRRTCRSWSKYTASQTFSVTGRTVLRVGMARARRCWCIRLAESSSPRRRCRRPTGFGSFGPAPAGFRPAAAVPRRQAAARLQPALDLVHVVARPAVWMPHSSPWANPKPGVPPERIMAASSPVRPRRTSPMRCRQCPPDGAAVPVRPTTGRQNRGSRWRWRGGQAQQQLVQLVDLARPGSRTAARVRTMPCSESSTVRTRPRDAAASTAVTTRLPAPPLTTGAP